jgi:hypothetical protein
MAYVFTMPETDVKSVQFYLDNTQMDGAPLRTEYYAPFDLEGTVWDGSAWPLDTATLANGWHSVTARVTRMDGSSQVLTGWFRIGTDSPEATPTPVPTATPTAVPTSTPTPVPTATPTAVPVPTATPTALPTATATPPVASQPTVVTLDVAVKSSRDDAYMDPRGWPNYSDSDGVVFAGAPGRDGPVWGGWRWADLNIPAGAEVLEAYVELNQADWGSKLTTVLALQNAKAPVSFSQTDSPYARWSDRTNATVQWNWNRGRPGDWHRTPSLAAALQELVNRHGGVSNVVMLETAPGLSRHKYHSWTSFDGRASGAARLHVVYRVPGQ